MRAFALTILLLMAPGSLLAQEADDDDDDTEESAPAEPVSPPEAAPAEDPAATPPSGSTPAPPARASAPAPGGGPTMEKIGISLTNLGRLDLATGSFNAEFFLTFTCPEGTATCPTEFELDGGTVTKMDRVDEEPGRIVMRVKADIAADLDLSEYPMDEHELSICFNHPSASTAELVYEVDGDDTAVDETVKLPGYEIGEYEASVETNRFEGYDQDTSVYSFDLTVHRVRLTSILKSFLPPLFIVLVASLGLLLKVKSLTNRLGMGTAGLLSAVMFHISSTSALPPLGYLTRADKFMIGTYVILVANILATVLMLVRDDRKDEAGANAIFGKALVGIPLLALVVYAMVMLRIV